MIPAGWKIEKVGDRIAVTHPDLGGYAAGFNPDDIAETTLHRLAEALLRVQSESELTLLRRACDAAFAFIDSHVADPDLTDEMVRKHADYLEARRALEGRP